MWDTLRYGIFPTASFSLKFRQMRFLQGLCNCARDYHHLVRHGSGFLEWPQKSNSSNCWSGQFFAEFLRLGKFLSHICTTGENIWLPICSSLCPTCLVWSSIPKPYFRIPLPTGMELQRRKSSLKNIRWVPLVLRYAPSRCLWSNLQLTERSSGLGQSKKLSDPAEKIKKWIQFLIKYVQTSSKMFDSLMAFMSIRDGWSTSNQVTSLFTQLWRLPSTVTDDVIFFKTTRNLLSSKQFFSLCLQPQPKFSKLIDSLQQ